jgi:hypothetical protein
MAGISNTTQLYIKIRDNNTGIEKWTELDINDDMPMPLIYSISDVKDITRRNSSYSKTIRIPGTSHNNQIFSHIFDVSLAAAIPIFNPNKKLRCYILRDTLQIFEGSFQLRNVISDDNRHCSYECIIYGENSSFGQTIKELFVNDLRSLVQLDHFYTYQSIVDTWDKDWTYGYYYPLIDYGKFTSRFRMQSNFRGPRVTDLKPSIYVKWIWDQIFDEAGFIYESEFLNSDIFKRLIIPSSKLSQKASLFWLYLNTFRAGLTADQNITATQSVPFGPPYPAPSQDSIIWLRPNSAFRFVERIKFNDDVTAPNGDPSDQWNPTLFEYTEGQYPKPQTFYLDLHYTYYNAWGGRYLQETYSTFFDQQGNFHPEWMNAYRAELRIKRSMDVSGNVVPGGVAVKIDNAQPFYGLDPGNANLTITPFGTDKPDFPVAPFNAGFGPESNKWVYLLGGFEYIYPGDSNWPGFPVSLQPYDGISNTNPYVFESNNIVAQDRATFSGFVEWKGQLAITLDDSSFENQSLRPGEKLWAEVTIQVTRETNNDMFSTSGVPLKIHSSSLIFNSPDNQVVEGGIISVADSLPEKVKQIDFVTSIIKMFNLFVETDKDDARKLIIEPRDQYYETGVNKDWTDKFDILKETKHDIIAEMQNRKLIYTYKEDKDLLNTVYKQRFGEVYGEFEYVIDNDFTTGEKKYEVIFSPTPLVQLKDMPGLIVPSIEPVDSTQSEKFAPRIRILQKRSANLPLLSDYYWTLNGITQSSYPYAGNLDHPTEGTLDLNFGPVAEVYYPQNLLTNNNLFNVYHRRMIQELTDRSSRLVTAYFYLTPQDVARLRFNDSIFVDQLNSGTGQYYRINKIEYDPLRDGSYRVELLKILNVPALYFPGITSSNPTTEPPVVKPPIGGNRPLGTSNKVDGLAGFVVGSNNLLDSIDSVLAVGDDHYVGPNVSGTFISGEGHKVPINVKNSSIVGGKNNEITPGVENGLILGGENLKLTQNNTIMFGSIIIGPTNYISAGRDEVLNPFATGKAVNYISGSRDAVRNLGSHDVVNKINAGGSGTSVAP